MLNKQVARQNSLSRMFVAGIVYGVGFFIGSAILATIALGIVAPLFTDIGWISEPFSRGAALER